MKVKILGIQSVNYTSHRTGNPVKGVTLHSMFKDSQVTGDAVSSIFVSDALQIPVVGELKVGQTVDIEYNNRGFVCGLSFCN